MAQTVLITLTIAGADTGPFDLYSNIDGYTVPFENNVSKLDLEAGYTSVVVPDSATTIRVQSDNVLCSNFVDLVIVTTTTTTSSSTSSTTTTSTSTSSTTTSTSSSTTTTTTTLEPCLPGPYTHYLSDQYDCTTCVLVIVDVIVALPTSITAEIGDFYNSCVPSDYVYQLKSVTLDGPAQILDNIHTPTCVNCIVA